MFVKFAFFFIKSHLKTATFEVTWSKHQLIKYVNNNKKRVGNTDFYLEVKEIASFLLAANVRKGLDPEKNHDEWFNG